MSRRLDIEACRLLAAMGIVWFHAQAPASAWAYGGLVFFITLTVWLGQSGAPVQALPSLWRQRAARLLLPWLLWVALYGAVNRLLGLPFWPASPHPALSVLAGPSIHLWYLPFVFFALAAADAVRRCWPPRTVLIAAAGGASALALWPALWRSHSLQAPYPLLQWADGLLPVLHGLLLAIVSPRAAAQGAGSAGASPRWNAVVWAFAPPCLAGLAWWLGLDAGFGPALMLGGGTAAALALAPPGWTSRLASWALRWPHAARAVQWSAAQTFGTYLAHSLVHGWLLRHTTWQGAPMAVAVFAISFSGVAALRAWAPRWRDHWS